MYMSTVGDVVASVPARTLAGHQEPGQNQNLNSRWKEVGCYEDTWL